jgi:hypothetical protein
VLWNFKNTKDFQEHPGLSGVPRISGVPKIIRKNKECPERYGFYGVPRMFRYAENLRSNKHFTISKVSSILVVVF